MLPYILCRLSFTGVRHFFFNILNPIYDIMQYSVVIAGGGPAGLSCAKVLAENGTDVLVLERKSRFGPKVCAGGITWSGLINTIPGQIEEKRFPTQHVFTRLQHAKVVEKEPIIATVSREKLGQHMAQLATKSGAVLKASCQIIKIKKHSLIYLDRLTGEEHKVDFGFLVGADGSSSAVRRYLKIPTESMGVGINYQVPRHANEMEWHLDNRFFGNGYGWIFPHTDSVSIGAYADRKTMPAQKLKSGLIDWARTRGYRLDRHWARAEYINFDYRGWDFGNMFLAGDAAGFASGLTGEGIYPAIVSGEYIGRQLASIEGNDKNFHKLVRVQKIHARALKLTGRNSLLTGLLAESVALALRTGLLDFKNLEMGKR